MNETTSDDASATTSNINFKLPEFWPKDPIIWFTQIEAIFSVRKITSDKSKYSILVSSISPELATEVRDILLNPPEVNSYEILKKKIIQRTSLSEQTRIQKLIHLDVLDDEKPSQILRKMEQLLGEESNTTENAFLKQIFLQKLPNNVRVVLAALDESSSLASIASIADKIMESNTEYRVAATSFSPKQDFNNVISRHQSCQCQADNSRLSKDISDIKEILKTASFPRTGRFLNPNSRSFPRNSSPPSSRYCFYHTRFGKNAHKCNPPCS